MRTPAEVWVEILQRTIEEGRAHGYDSYVIALHIYSDVVAKALQEKQDEFDRLFLYKHDGPPN